MSDENLALNNRLLAHRVKELEAQRDEARNQGIPWSTVKEHKQQLDRMRDRAAKAESELESANGEAAYWSGRAKSAENDRDAFKKAMLRRAGELADQDFRIQKANAAADEWREYAHELGRELDERNKQAFLAEPTESEQLWEEVARRDEAEQRASQHWEAAKAFYRMYDAAMEEVSDLQVELWELKRALRILGGER